MANTILENGIDICKPVPCPDEYPEIVVRSYTAANEEGSPITVSWDIIADGNLTTNKLLWSDDPSKLTNSDLGSQVTASGTGPYTASFTPVVESLAYFQVEAVIDNFTRRSAVYVVETELGLSTSS